MTEVTKLPDGSAFAVASLPLPATHWIYEDTGEPPAPWGTLAVCEQVEVRTAVQAALRYAIKGATMNGRETDFDPDALVQNMMVGLFGYCERAKCAEIRK